MGSPLFVPIVCASDFELGALLQEAFAQESDAVENVDDPPEDVDIAPEDIGVIPEDPESSKSLPIHPPVAAEGSGVNRSHRRRRKKRQDNISAVGHRPRKQAGSKYTEMAHSVSTDLALEDLPVARGGYSAIPGKKHGAKKSRCVEELIERGFTYVEWNGR